MDDFLEEFFPQVYHRKHQNLQETDYCKYDNQILTLFTSSLYFAALVSTFGASHITRTKGRRASILVGVSSFFIGALLNAFAKNIAMPIIGRCFLGFGIGFGNQLTTCLGILVANFINYGTEQIHPWGWRLSLGLATVPATLMGAGGIFLPETPNSLVEMDRMEEARRVLEKVRGTKNVDTAYEVLVEASEAAKAIKNPFRNLLLRNNRPALILGGLGIPAFQQLTGNNSTLFYAPVIFQTLGFGAGALLISSTLSSAMLVIAACISMALVDKFGRRAFLIEASVEMSIYHLVVGTILALNFGKGKQISDELGYFLVVCIFLFVLAYGRSWGPMGWLVPSELFPLETRSAGQSMVVCVNMIFTSIIVQCFLISLCHLRYGIFILFAGLIVIMGLFVFFLLPETKQVPIEEVHFLFKETLVLEKVCQRGQSQ